LAQTIPRVILTSEDNGTPNSEGKSFQKTRVNSTHLTWWKAQYFKRRTSH